MSGLRKLAPLAVRCAWAALTLAGWGGFVCAGEEGNLGVKVLSSEFGDNLTPDNIKLALAPPPEVLAALPAFGSENLEVYIFPESVAEVEATKTEYRARGVLVWQEGGAVFADVRKPPAQKAPGKCRLLARIVRGGQVLSFAVAGAEIGYSSDNVDVVLVIDSSLSMLKSDRKRQRVAAARAFIELSARGGRIRRIGVVSFNNYAEILAPLTSLSSKDILLDALRNVGDDGQTNMDRALEAAEEVLGSGPGARCAVVFLTDGRNEPARYCDTHLKFKAAGVPMFAIGLSGRADHELLARMARDTGGKSFNAATPAELLGIYQQVAAEIGRKVTLAAENVPGGRDFAVPLDSSVRSADFLLETGEGGEAALLDPHGLKAAAGVFGEKSFVSLAQEREFLLARVVAPEPGEWKLSVPAAGGKATVTAETDLFLDIFPPQLVGRTLRLGATLARGENPVRGGRVKLLSGAVPGLGEAELYDDGAHGDGAAEDGVYSCGVDLPPEAAGEANLLLRAWGKTEDGGGFVRQAGLQAKGIKPAPPAPAPVVRLAAGPLDFGTLVPGETAQAVAEITLEAPAGGKAGFAIPQLADARGKPMAGGLSVRHPGTVCLSPGRNEVEFSLAVPVDAKPGEYSCEVSLGAAGAGAQFEARVRVAKVSLALAGDRAAFGRAAPGATLTRELTLTLSAPRALPLGWSYAGPVKPQVGCSTGAAPLPPGKSARVKIAFRVPLNAKPGVNAGEITFRCGPAIATFPCSFVVPPPPDEPLPEAKFPLVLAHPAPPSAPPQETPVSVPPAPQPDDEELSRRAWEGMRGELFWLALLAVLLLALAALLLRLAARNRMARYALAAAAMNLLVALLFVTLLAPSAVANAVRKPRIVARLVELKETLGIGLSPSERRLLEAGREKDAEAAKLDLAKNAQPEAARASVSEAEAASARLRQEQELRQRLEAEQERLRREPERVETETAKLPEPKPSAIAAPAAAAVASPAERPVDVETISEPTEEIRRAIAAPVAATESPRRETVDLTRLDAATERERLQREALPQTSDSGMPKTFAEKRETQNRPAATREEVKPQPAAALAVAEKSEGELQKPLPATEPNRAEFSAAAHDRLLAERLTAAPVRLTRELPQLSATAQLPQAAAASTEPRSTTPSVSVAAAPEDDRSLAETLAAAEPAAEQGKAFAVAASNVPELQTPGATATLPRQELAAARETSRVRPELPSAPLRLPESAKTPETAAAENVTTARPVAAAGAPADTGQSLSFAASMPEMRRLAMQPATTIGEKLPQERQAAVGRMEGLSPSVAPMRKDNLAERNAPAPLPAAVATETNLPAAPAAPKAQSGNSGTAPAALELDMTAGSARPGRRSAAAFGGDLAQAPTARTAAGQAQRRLALDFARDEALARGEVVPAVLPAALPRASGDDGEAKIIPAVAETAGGAPTGPRRFSLSGEVAAAAQARRAVYAPATDIYRPERGAPAMNDLRGDLRPRTTPMGAVDQSEDSNERLSTSTGPGAVSVVVGLVRFGSDWDSSPLAVANMLASFKRNLETSVKVEKRVVSLERKSIADCPLLFMTGNLPFTLSSAEADAARAYLAGGGLLWVNDSTAEGDEAFDKAFRRELPKITDRPLKHLPADHPLFASGYDFTKGFRGYAVPPGDKYRVDYLEGVEIDGHLAVLYTRNDYADGMSLDPGWSPNRKSLTDLSEEDMQQASLMFGINVMCYSLGIKPEASLPGTLREAEKRRLDPQKLALWQDFSGLTRENLFWQSVDSWGNPVAISPASDGNGGMALRLDLKGGNKDKAAVKYEIPAQEGRRLDLSKTRSVVLDLHNGFQGGFRFSLVFTTVGADGKWRDFESPSQYLRPGWNRDLTIDLTSGKFKTRETGWKNYDSTLENVSACGKITLLFYNRGQIEAAILLDNIRFEQK